MHCNMARINFGYEPAGDVATLFMASQAPHCFREALQKAKTMSIIWDSDASISLSCDRTDFVGVLKPAGATTRLQGIAEGLFFASKDKAMFSGQCSTPGVGSA
jgi:hypothetical protein